MRFDALATLVLAPLVAGHGAVTSYIIGGTEYPGYDGFNPSLSRPTIQFQWPNYDPTMSVSDIKMRCNGGTSAALSASIAAGQNITAVWKQWTHAQGPVMVWMYKCPGAFGSSCTGEGKGWFKIDQYGLVGNSLNSENWGTALVLRNLKWTSKIPSNLAPGNYLIRHELLALHQANTPQFYAECAQIVVSGSGSATPPSDYLYSIPVYAPQNDPGITVRDALLKYQVLAVLSLCLLGHENTRLTSITVAAPATLPLAVTSGLVSSRESAQAEMIRGNNIVHVHYVNSSSIAAPGLAHCSGLRLGRGTTWGKHSLRLARIVMVFWTIQLWIDDQTYNSDLTD